MSLASGFGRSSQYTGLENGLDTARIQQLRMWIWLTSIPGLVQTE